MALLDITKAYDRVNRNILWRMEQMGVPDKLIKASYRNPSTILVPRSNIRTPTNDTGTETRMCDVTNTLRYIQYCRVGT